VSESERAAFARIDDLLDALAAAYDPPAWWNEARCRGMDLRTFVPPARLSVCPPAIVALCSTCPALLACLEAAVTENDRSAYRGATTPKDRRALRKGRVIAVSDLRLYYADGKIGTLDPDASTAIDLPVLARLEPLLDRLTDPTATWAAPAVVTMDAWVARGRLPRPSAPRLPAGASVAPRRRRSGVPVPPNPRSPLSGAQSARSGASAGNLAASGAPQG
jgi:hypothetical protein